VLEYIEAGREFVDSAVSVLFEFWWNREKQLICVEMEECQHIDSIQFSHMLVCEIEILLLGLRLINHGII